MSMRSQIAALALASTASLGEPGPVDAPPPIRARDPVEVQVLFHSVELSLDLIDAYGRCRDDDRDHAECMAILRASLRDARTLIEP